MNNELQEFYKNALVGSLCEPLCDEYKAKWRACGSDKWKLVALSLNQQAIPYVASYCNKGKGVSKKFILSEFGEYINGFTIQDADDIRGYTYGLFVDYDCDEDLVADKDVCHLMWCVGSSVVVPETSCVTLYISNRSNVHLVCNGFNSIRIYLFDSSEVEIEDLPEDSNVVVYKYSSNCSVAKGKYAFGDIKEHNKELRL